MLNEREKKLNEKAGLSAKQSAVLAKLLKGKAISDVQNDSKSGQIPKREIHSPAVLSFSQQRLWVMDRLVPGNPFYNLPTAVILRGEVNIPIFEQALNEIVRRHESLRTIFAVDSRTEEPQQVILPELKIKMTIMDLQGLVSAHQQEEAIRLAAEEAGKPFNLGLGPLVRVLLLTLAEDRHVLALTMHHIISDAWSLGLFIREFAAVYASFAAGRLSPLPEPRIQYADFAQWQRQWMQGEVLEKQLSYWRDRLAGELPILELPTDRQRPAVPTYRGGYQSIELPDTLFASLTELSRREKCSMFMTLLAAFNVLLYRYSGQEDIMVGAPIANRNRPEIEGMIGFFANTLVFRADLSGNPSFRQLMARVNKVTSGAYDNQDLPFEKLVEEFQPDRYMSHTPFFQVMFNFRAVELKKEDAQDAAGLTIEDFPVHNRTSKFDLWFTMHTAAEKLWGGVEYNTDIFEDDSIARFIEHFKILITAIADNPDQAINELPLMSETEKNRVLKEWNATDKNYPIQCLHNMFVEQAAKTPDHVELVGDVGHAGPVNITYRQLNEQSDYLAQLLIEKGVLADNIVGIMMERSVEMVIGLLGILKSGGAYLPIDPELPQERIDYMLKDSGAKLLVTINDKEGEKICCRDVARNVSTNFLPSYLLNSSNLAYMIYTSGSTGKPKGVMVPHKGISNRLYWMQETYRLTADDKVLQKTPYGFDVSVWEFFWPLSVGAVLVMAKPGGHKDGAYLVKIINKFGITTIHFVPAMLNVFLEDPGFGGILCLKRVICSGEALPAEYRDRFYARLHPGAGTELHNLYGPTEASVDVTAWACERDDKRHVVPIGQPIANTQIYILDKNQNPVPVGVHGELCIAGIQLARGYINRPELTAERFNRSYRSYRTNIFYKTGDLTRWLPDGTIEFIGRLDFQVKVRGFRIELGEIESSLRSHPGVEDAAVLPWEEPADSGGKKLVAYVIPGNCDQYLADEQIGDWQDVFNDTYTKDAGQVDPIFNIIGWNSSYTGAAIPAEEMRIWVDRTVERILGLKARRIIEIGCGTGLFLFPIIPHCERYLGSDIASQGLNYIRSRLEQLKTTEETSGWAEVELLQRGADNFEGLETEALDLVFLNSVVQYFPTVDYLVKVIKGAVEVLKPGGHIFLGDIRSLPLLKTFHASVEFHRAEAGVNREQLHRLIMSRMALEQELVIDPDFFNALQQQVPAIKEVEILVKYGRYNNELSKFRYDVILHLHNHVAPLPSFTLDWKKDKPGIPELREWLREMAQNPTAPGPILISGIADSRTAVDMNLLRWLSGPGEATTVGQFREAMTNVKESAIDPQDFLELAQNIPYDIALTPSPLEPGAFHAVCWPRIRDTRNEAGETAGNGILSPEDKGEAENSLFSYTNNPLLVKISAQLVPELRAYLKERLPEYMVPSNFVLLDHLPLTSSGKLNRRALPEPGQVMQEMENSFVEPSTPLETLLVEIWQRVLNLEKVGIKNNFFELGGDSIKAIQVVSRVNKEGYPITVQHLYLNQNIADLAGAAAKMQNTGAETGAFNISEQELIMDIDRKILLDQLPAGAEIEDILPVTPQQRHMLETLEMFEQSGESDPGLFVIHKKYLPRRFNLDPEILKQVLAKVVAHRALLRSAFIRRGLEEPVQVICKQGEIPLTYRDLSHLPQAEQQEQFNEFIREEWRLGFDRTRPNAVRMGLVKFGEGHFQFFFTSDYIRFDGWSSGIIQNEVVYCYNMQAMGDDLKLREEQQYKYYLAALKKEDIGTAEKYWRSIFQGYESPSGSLIDRFPCNTPRSVKGFARQFVYLSPETTGIIDSFLQRYRLVHSSLIFAIWAMLLSRYTEETDIVFGVIYSGRTIAAASGIEGMVGNTINVLPMRITIDSQRIVLNWLQEIFNRQVEANKYEYTPLRKIKEWCGLSPQKPMFETYIVMQNLPSPSPEDTVDDEKVVKMLTDMGAGKKPKGASALPPDKKEYELFFAKMEYPLRVDIYTPGQFCPVFNYERSRFADSVVKGYMENMVTLLESIVANPYQSVEELLGQINPEKYPEAEPLPLDYV